MVYIILQKKKIMAKRKSVSMQQIGLSLIDWRRI